MSTVLFWFRNDLRLHDQPALRAALTSGATHLLPVVCLPAPDEPTPWGFARVGAHRRAFTAAALRGLQGQMSTLGNPLLICQAPPATALPRLAQAVGATTVVCEDIAAPYEEAEVAALRAAGLQVRTVWHSSLLPPARMPWSVDQLPGVFTSFRQKVERAGITPPRHCPHPPNCCRRPNCPQPCCKPWAQSRALPASSKPHRHRAAMRARPSPMARLRVMAASLPRWPTWPSTLPASCPTATRTRAPGSRGWITPASSRPGWPRGHSRRARSMPI